MERPPIIAHPDWPDPHETPAIVGPSVLQVLEDARLFTVGRALHSRGFVLRNAVERLYSVVLTPAQLYSLGTDLQALAEPYLHLREEP